MSFEYPRTPQFSDCLLNCGFSFFFFAELWLVKTKVPQNKAITVSMTPSSPTEDKAEPRDGFKLCG